MRKITFLILCFMFLAACTNKPDKIDNSGAEASSKPKSSQDIKKKEIDKKSQETFLLIGIDTRGEVQSRADTIVIAQYDYKENNLKLASIMRDCFVEIPSYPKRHNKINAAYYYGGTELLKKTILENFKLEIDHAASIDFQGFKRMVDLLAPDGIEVQVDEEMIDDMAMEVSAGLIRLHGEEVLKYVRYRHDKASDFGRVQRQQEVLLQLKNEIAGRLATVEGITALPEIITEGRNLIETDIKVNTILDIGSQLIINKRGSVQTLRIPINGTFQDKLDPHAGAVLEIQMTENQQALSKFFSNSSGQ
ncbi:transcriptional regulator [Bacillus sp. M6-12]|uniref:LCP family protein n=1 Tax=Bacillus sp. M6-12 TaxID=2054166 RepID=UPI000C7765B9|nr:LCP family protein [Bacillus sp. M6-12]PLS17067.1 transcriptional regulator [Bacillus sp. M6-12]